MTSPSKDTGRGLGDELLPCPFCGKPPKYEQNNSFHTICCMRRGCAIAEVCEGSFDEAAKRWNRRSPAPSGEMGRSALKKTIQSAWDNSHDGFEIDTIVDAVLALAPSPASVPGEGEREPTPHWQRRWAHDGPNGWNLDSAGFLALIQAHPLMWLALGRAKYLELRIDTRDDAFNLYDRDKKPLNPDDVISAIEKVKADFGDAALQSARGSEEE